MESLKTSWLARLISLVTRRIPLMSGCGKLANGRWLPVPVRDPGSGILKLRNGRRIRASLPDYIGNALFYFGDHDPKVTAVMRRFLGEGDTAIDIGANIGVSSLFASEFVGPRGRVIAFEPQPGICAMLEETFAGEENANIRLLPCALGDQDREITLRVPKGNLGGGSIVHQFKEGCAEEVTARERVTEEVFRELGLGHIRLVKIDVEGYEAHVLAGACRFWKEDPPEVIIFEYRDATPLADSELASLLNPFGYQFHFMISHPWKLELRPVDELRPGETKSHDVVALLPSVSAEIRRG